MNANVEPIPYVARAQASALATAATLLDTAKQSREDLSGLVGALDLNLQLWVAIVCIASKDECDLPLEAKSNLAILSRYVRDVTIKFGAEISDPMIETLVNINLQIADGLLVGAESLPKI